MRNEDLICHFYQLPQLRKNTTKHAENFCAFSVLLLIFLWAWSMESAREADPQQCDSGKLGVTKRSTKTRHLASHETLLLSLEMWHDRKCQKWFFHPILRDQWELILPLHLQGPDRKWYWWKTTLCRLEFSPPHQRRTVFVICTGFFLQERSKRCTPRVHVDQNVDVIWKSLNIPLEIQEKVSEIITPFHAHRPVGILTACHVPLRTYGFREY